MAGSFGYSERVSLLGPESARKTASGLPPALLLDKGLRYEEVQTRFPHKRVIGARFGLCGRLRELYLSIPNRHVKVQMRLRADCQPRGS